MKTQIKVILGAVFALASVTACSTIGTAYFGHPLDWSVIEGTGGASLSTPYKTKDGWAVDTAIDISGLKPGSTQMNSAMVCTNIQVRKDGRTLLLIAYGGLATVSKSDAKCAPARLGTLEPGIYSVAYGETKLGSRPIGSISIPK